MTLKNQGIGKKSSRSSPFHQELSPELWNGFRGNIPQILSSPNAKICIFFSWISSSYNQQEFQSWWLSTMWSSFLTVQPRASRQGRRHSRLHRTSHNNLVAVLGMQDISRPIFLDSPSQAPLLYWEGRDWASLTIEGKTLAPLNYSESWCFLEAPHSAGKLLKQLIVIIVQEAANYTNSSSWGDTQLGYCEVSVTVSSSCNA